MDQPLDYADASLQRSRIPTVVGGIGVAYGVTALAFRTAVFIWIAVVVADRTAGNRRMIGTGVIVNDFFLNVSGLVMAVWLIVAAIGLLLRREWGRHGLLLWSCFMLGVAALATTLAVIFTGPDISGLPAPQQAGRYARFLFVIIGIGLARAVFPIVCLILLVRPSVRAACA